MFESRHRRLKTFLHFRLTRRRDSSERPAMKRIMRRNDFESPGIMSHLARELEQSFVRLRAAVAKKDAARRDKIDHALRQPALQFIIIEIRNVNELPRLRVQRVSSL